MSTDAQPVAPSATVDAPLEAVSAAELAVASNDVSAYREARRAERSGKPLDAKPADSSPAPADTPADQTTSADSSPAVPEKKRTDKRATEHRVPELLAERAALRAEIEALKRAQTPPPTDAKPAAPSPATVETFPTYDAYLAEHPDASYEAYLDARSDFRVEQKLKAAREAEEQSSRRQRETQTVQERDTAFRKRLDEAVKADPEFMESLSDDVMALRPFSAIRDAQGRWTEQPTGYHAVADEVLSSEVAPQLLRHFSDHPEELHRIAKLLPTQLLKEMGKLEARITSGTVQPPPTKTITDAPPPAPTLSTRSSETGSAVDAAVASGDVAAYRAARLRERTANLR